LREYTNLNGKPFNFKDWLNLTEEERWKTHLNWNVYAGEGRDIAVHVLEGFKKEYSHIPRLRIKDRLGIYHGGIWVIIVEHPFIFDYRKIPKRYFGIEIKGGPLMKNMPKEFQVRDSEKEYVWAPERYEKFVDRCTDEIRKELGDMSMSREEMLNALCPGGDFKAWIRQSREWEKEGKIPPAERRT
jgi:hypothetical protein